MRLEQGGAVPRLRHRPLGAEPSRAKGQLLAALLGCALAAAVWSGIGWGRARAQAPILRPEDVATPTPTQAVILLPTPTPMAGTPAVQQFMEPQGRTQGYTVQPGDTLWTAALEMGVDLEDAPCLVAPDFRPQEPLVIGDRLEPLPVGWRCHRVAAGETLAQVAAQYGVDVRQIRGVAWNRLPGAAALDSPLPPDRYVRVPGRPAPTSSGFMAFMLDQPLAVSPYMAYAVGGPGGTAAAAVPETWPYGSGRFTWPVFGWLSQGYREDHPALDIAAPTGAFVTAADRGVVIRAGWNEQGYGNFVVIDHHIDYVTLYSHLADVLVEEGEVVAQGQIIGTVGSTGNSTGAHLHFEIRDFGRRANPLELLMR